MDLSRTACPRLPIFNDLHQVKGASAEPKKQKLGATHFTWDANGKNPNPDLGSKNKRPDFSQALHR